VQVFGRRHDEAIHALMRRATEKRQGTKSRWVTLSTISIPLSHARAKPLAETNYRAAI